MSIIGIEPIGVVLRRQRERNEARRRLRELRNDPAARLRAITGGGGRSGGSNPTPALSPNAPTPAQPAQPAQPTLASVLPEDRGIGELTATELTNIMRDNRRSLPFDSKLALLRAKRRAVNRERQQGRLGERLGSDALGSSV